MSAFSLKEKRVVLIGGASGIGLAVAELAAAQGAAIVVGSSEKARVATALERLPKGTTGHPVDVRDETSVDAFFTAIGRFDHLVYTAGDWNVQMRRATRDIDVASAREFFTVRFWGAVIAAKYAARTIAPDGSITLTSGMYGHRPRPTMAVAAGLGGGIEALGRGLAIDLAPIRVNIVSPGLILTEMMQAAYADERQLAPLVQRLPIPRGATPKEAAEAYVYAMSNGYVTGQTFPIDGGALLVSPQQ